MTDCQGLSLPANRLEPNEKRAIPEWVGGCRRKRFERNKNFLGGCKDRGFEEIGMEGSVRSCAGLMWLGAAVSC